MQDEKGVLKRGQLPNEDFEQLWDRIIVPPELKDSLLSQIVLEFTVRSKFALGVLPLHGIILLVGPPGTGKTSLAKASASKAASVLEQNIQFIEAEPHSLTSSALGKSQRAVQSFFQDTITEHAAQGPLIVLLDEVETLAADRSKMSMEANPIDVHRATDAVLASLDTLAAAHPHLLFLATSNFEGAIDEAFLSRADMVLRVEKPGREACDAILRDTLTAMSSAYPDLVKIADESLFQTVVKDAVGLDGRQLRKSVLQACTFDKNVALDPNRLRVADLHRAIQQIKGAKK